MPTQRHALRLTLPLALAAIMATAPAAAAPPAATSDTPAIAAIAATTAAAPATAPTPPAVSNLNATIEQGRYLATAADCMACHSTAAGKPYAGGYPLASPLGVIYTSNITPSKRYGIGNYSEAQFARALRQGVRADGAHLYPAMPYTSYTLLSDADVHALYLYFMQAVLPVEQPAPSTVLPFPFNLRWSMLGWNALFLHDRRFAPDNRRSAQVNRGAYLAEGLAHCSACHTPRNAFMGERGGLALSGAPLGSWHAPNITSDPVSGVGGWTDAELAQYLKTGQVAGKGQAAGAMAEAVQNSLQFLHDDDIAAIVAYLRTVPAVRDTYAPATGATGATGATTTTTTAPGPSYAYGRAVSAEAALRGRNGPNERNSLTSGAVLYSGYCASCHQPGGTGSIGLGGEMHGNEATGAGTVTLAGNAEQAYPSLLHNTATGSGNPANLISVILNGVERKVGDREVLMPRFDAHSYVNPLTDDQIAAISNYVLQQYGNPDVRVSAADVAQARRGGAQPLLATLQPYIAPAIVLVILLLLLCILLLRNRRRRRRLQRRHGDYNGNDIVAAAPPSASTPPEV